MKVCSLCKESKEVSFFYRMETTKDKLHPYCKICIKEKNAKYYKKNTSSCSLNTMLWKKNNRERTRELNSKSRKNNLASLANKEARRRATKKKATPSWANEFFIQEIYHLSNLRTRTTGVSWEVDHIVPLNSKLVCGLHVENNLQVIPESYNRRKSNIYWPNMP